MPKILAVTAVLGSRPASRGFEIASSRKLCRCGTRFIEVYHRDKELAKFQGGHTKKEYLMKSRLICSKCGYAMRGQLVQGKHQYYLYNGRRQAVSLCDKPSVREIGLMSLFGNGQR